MSNDNKRIELFKLIQLLHLQVLIESCDLDAQGVPYFGLPLGYTTTTSVYYRTGGPLLSTGFTATARASHTCHRDHQWQQLPSPGSRIEKKDVYTYQKKKEGCHRENMGV